jgi:signal transduction histidine kinase
MTPRSLRSRVLLGALLWTLGLIAISHVVSGVLFFRVPQLLLIAHSTLLLVFAIGCLIGGLSQVRGGLSTFDRLRSALASVRNGSDQRIGGAYPAEVQPLVDELNAFLDHREQTVSRAVSKAGDLAHGLKTPLAVLSQEAAHAAADGHQDLAAAIELQVERMRRQVDYHLAQARAAASGATAGTRCLIATSAEGLTRTLQRLHADRGIAIDLQVPPAHAARVQREDLDEMLGNLLDNACKWASSRVCISSRIGGDRVEILIEDDGPGIADGLRAEVLRRGVRADEASPGSGLGLAIVRDLAELYSGTISLDTSRDGGVRARLTLPSA